MTVTVNELRSFFVEAGAKMAFDGYGPRDNINMLPAHYEVAESGSVCWLRRKPAEPFKGTMLLMQDLAEYPDTRTLHRDQILIAHPDMRSLVARMIDEFFQSPLKGMFSAQSARVHDTVKIIDGQNYLWAEDGWAPFPHSATALIDTGAEIGVFATIARGTMGPTYIGRGCRIGQHVNIGHDCRIGDHTIIVAGASLAGWVRVGERVKIYQGALIKNGVSIGDGAVIGMGAVVTKDVPAGETWAGNPARRV